MTNITQQLRQIQAIEIQQFLATGILLEEADETQPWKEEGLTRRQWLAGEGLPLRTANQARDLYYLVGNINPEGLTLNKLKLILPELKVLEGDETAQEELIGRARTLLFNDLRDSLKETAGEECERGEWEEHTYWRCPKNGKRTYTNPNLVEEL